MVNLETSGRSRPSVADPGWRKKKRPRTRVASEGAKGGVREVSVLIPLPRGEGSTLRGQLARHEEALMSDTRIVRHREIPCNPKAGAPR